MNIIKNLIFKIQYTIRKTKLEKIKAEYPNVMSTTATLNRILEGCSIVRFGDGELQIIIGKSLGKRGTKNEYQVYDKNLADKLRKIIKTPTENCIISIDRYSDKYNDKKNYKYGLSYFENFWYRNWDKLKNLYKYDYVYGETAFDKKLFKDAMKLAFEMFCQK